MTKWRLVELIGSEKLVQVNNLFNLFEVRGSSINGLELASAMVLFNKHLQVKQTAEKLLELICWEKGGGSSDVPLLTDADLLLLIASCAQGISAFTKGGITKGAVSLDSRAESSNRTGNSAQGRSDSVTGSSGDKAWSSRGGAKGANTTGTHGAPDPVAAAAAGGPGEGGQATEGEGEEGEGEGGGGGDQLGFPGVALVKPPKSVKEVLEDFEKKREQAKNEVTSSELMSRGVRSLLDSLTKQQQRLAAMKTAFPSTPTDGILYHWYIEMGYSVPICRTAVTAPASHHPPSGVDSVGFALSSLVGLRQESTALGAAFEASTLLYRRSDLLRCLAWALPAALEVLVWLAGECAASPDPVQTVGNLQARLYRELTGGLRRFLALREFYCFPRKKILRDLDRAHGAVSFCDFLTSSYSYAAAGSGGSGGLDFSSLPALRNSAQTLLQSLREQQEKLEAKGKEEYANLKRRMRSTRSVVGSVLEGKCFRCQWRDSGGGEQWEGGLFIFLLLSVSLCFLVSLVLFVILRRQFLLRLSHVPPVSVFLILIPSKHGKMRDGLTQLQGALSDAQQTKSFHKARKKAFRAAQGATAAAKAAANGSSLDFEMLLLESKRFSNQSWDALEMIEDPRDKERTDGSGLPDHSLLSLLGGFESFPDPKEISKGTVARENEEKFRGFFSPLASKMTGKPPPQRPVSLMKSVAAQELVLKTLQLLCLEMQRRGVEEWESVYGGLEPLIESAGGEGNAEQPPVAAEGGGGQEGVERGEGEDAEEEEEEEEEEQPVNMEAPEDEEEAVEPAGNEGAEEDSEEALVAPPGEGEGEGLSEEEDKEREMRDKMPDWFAGETAEDRADPAKEATAGPDDQKGDSPSSSPDEGEEDGEEEDEERGENDGDVSHREEEETGDDRHEEEPTGTPSQPSRPACSLDTVLEKPFSTILRELCKRAGTADTAHLVAANEDGTVDLLAGMSAEDEKDFRVARFFSRALFMSDAILEAYAVKEGGRPSMNDIPSLPVSEGGPASEDCLESLKPLRDAVGRENDKCYLALERLYSLAHVHARFSEKRLRAVQTEVKAAAMKANTIGEAIQVVERRLASTYSALLNEHGQAGSRSSLPEGHTSLLVPSLIEESARPSFSNFPFKAEGSNINEQTPWGSANLCNEKLRWEPRTSNGVMTDDNDRLELPPSMLGYSYIGEGGPGQHGRLAAAIGSLMTADMLRELCGCDKSSFESRRRLIELRVRCKAMQRASERQMGFAEQNLQKTLAARGPDGTFKLDVGGSSATQQSDKKREGGEAEEEGGGRSKAPMEQRLQLTLDSLKSFLKAHFVLDGVFFLQDVSQDRAMVTGPVQDRVDSLLDTFHKEKSEAVVTGEIATLHPKDAQYPEPAPLSERCRETTADRAEVYCIDSAVLPLAEGAKPEFEADAPPPSLRFAASVFEFLAWEMGIDVGAPVDPRRSSVMSAAGGGSDVMAAGGSSPSAATAPGGGFPSEVSPQKFKAFFSYLSKCSQDRDIRAYAAAARLFVMARVRLCVITALLRGWSDYDALLHIAAVKTSRRLTERLWRQRLRSNAASAFLDLRIRGVHASLSFLLPLPPADADILEEEEVETKLKSVSKEREHIVKKMREHAVFERSSDADQQSSILIEDGIRVMLDTIKKGGSNMRACEHQADSYKQLSNMTEEADQVLHIDSVWNDVSVKRRQILSPNTDSSLQMRKTRAWRSRAVSFHFAGRHIELVPTGEPYLIAVPEEEWNEENTEKHQELVSEGQWHAVNGDQESKLIFIGIGLDKPRILQELKAALLTDEEMEGGPAQWKEMEDIFFGREFFDLQEAGDGEKEEDGEDEEEKEDEEMPPASGGGTVKENESGEVGGGKRKRVDTPLLAVTSPDDRSAQIKSGTEALVFVPRSSELKVIYKKEVQLVVWRCEAYEPLPS
uniref:CobW C-terminal domain-containing protein n=1 Tax=Chromera velia CCMP2878 TaxID=1169474 RepID=A0A0G4GP73_9ALVE|eukprot:Cvel_22775.t1-p1 / transcript=Cvel_22775.t1 / gene=Cvel_22775 / organism=Chromera_velia_CCMP2878 / gene_product=hypothetical protein / transcript_product=hypothetical protein / location=Cvel_scaffold2276:9416-25847(+) / protein_length=1918 / sequence_SO=supercontig / SO=protein_coding / is_pseudo=false